ncbi:hypothetical protein EN780_18425 [Mesorhizobium sp. M4B.F.Ca.ET.089.01.1.1]|nr:hypothetical protein EN780_18425 [Mesorhizobium sp. M4B.F.Ca.ET.089.01.1.1]
MLELGAAPHPPFGHLLPVNGEKAIAAPAVGETPRDKSFLPVTIRGEMPGRAMRGSADSQYF